MIIEKTPPSPPALAGSGSLSRERRQAFKVSQSENVGHFGGMDGTHRLPAPTRGHHRGAERQNPAFPEPPPAFPTSRRPPPTSRDVAVAWRCFDPGMPKRGFAALDPEKQKEIARLGGKAAHAQGKAHEFTSEEARVAGKKGGETVSRNSEHMRTIGRMGGRAPRRKRGEDTAPASE
jgi:general stress protein YciG